MLNSGVQAVWKTGTLGSATEEGNIVVEIPKGERGYGFDIIGPKVVIHSIQGKKHRKGNLGSTMFTYLIHLILILSSSFFLFFIFYFFVAFV